MKSVGMDTYINPSSMPQILLAMDKIKYVWILSDVIFSSDFLIFSLNIDLVELLF